MKRIILFLSAILLYVSCCCKKQADRTGQENTESKQLKEIGLRIPKIELVPLPAASFNMGSHSGDADETPVHIVIFTRDILLGKYEITNNQVASVYTWGLMNGKIKANTETVLNSEGEEKELIDIDYPDCQLFIENGIFSVLEGFENYPCTLISWYGAVLFCNLFSLIDNREPVYNTSDWSCEWEKDGYRLPTEAEWEYAARGGTKSKGFTYSGSNNPDEVAWYNKNAGGGTHPVGLKKPNEYGFYDMSGNVWECCWDFYGYYIPRTIEKDSFENDLLKKATRADHKEYIEMIYIKDSITQKYELTGELTNEECRKTWEIFRAIGYKMGGQTNPKGIIYRNKRVLRGGDWGSKTFYLRNTYRGRVFAQVSSTGYGFRIVRRESK